MINLERHTIQLGGGDVGVKILQGGSIEKPVPVFAFYNLNNESERILMAFSDQASLNSMIDALEHVREVYYPRKKKNPLGDTQRFSLK